MDQTTYDLFAPDVKSAAKSVAREWPDIVEEDDVEQDIWVRILEAGQGTIDTLAGMDKSNRVVSLTKIGHQIAAKERDDYDLFSGNWLYGTEHVRALLDEDGLLATPDEPGTHTHTQIIDLTEGMKRLRKKNAWYHEIILARYVDNDPVHDYRMELTRAVDALTVEMNRGSRSANAEFVGSGVSRD